MVKPAKRGPIRRRVITTSVYALSWLLLTALSPLWVPLALLVGLVRGRSLIILRLLLFAWFYVGLELIALVLVAWTFATRGDGEPRLRSLYRLQAWWASLTWSVAAKALHLRTVIDGADCAMPGPIILLIRHASILDTLLPSVYVQRPHEYRVRYVLKQELLFDPCIDVVGNALPNYFVDRTGNMDRELAGIRALVQNLGSDGVLIFPEGTRFSLKKRDKELRKLEAEASPRLAAARRLSHVLPPKPAGVLTLLAELPSVDCVFLSHTGLEAFAKVKDLLSGQVVGSTVHVELWRVSANEIPEEPDERLRWLDAQWEKVNAFVRNTTDTS
ncbi:MAG: lysophospholipid acyltransferase family protein [Deltaproteobacteria bacterium]|nr:lysophospholipid acyltransferase family protein [Deltaproteobacteria bacterium]